jgi:hypothetical protein
MTKARARAKAPPLRLSVALGQNYPVARACSAAERPARPRADFRYMATSDLLNELQKDSFRLDAEGERRVCQARARARCCVLVTLLPFLRAAVSHARCCRRPPHRRWC